MQQLISDGSVKNISLHGLVASSAPLFFSEVASLSCDNVFLFILNDADEAGYFYHDLSRVESRTDGAARADESVLSVCRVAAEEDRRSESRVLFFPSSYRRAVKYGQRDAANEILRTEVLAMIGRGARINGRGARVEDRGSTIHSPLMIVTYPEAMAELVVSQKHLDERMLTLTVNQQAEPTAIAKTLRDFGFQETDYVYEPGQFAVRGSIIDIYSFSHELPYRIDFFGNDIDTIRTFEVETQLSKERKESIEIVPDLSSLVDEKTPFLRFLPENTILVAKDFQFISDAISHIYDEGFSKQALAERLEDKTELEQKAIIKEMERSRQLCTATEFIRDAEKFKRITLERGRTEAKAQGNGSQLPTLNSQLSFHTSPQPLFHKNFDLLQATLNDYRMQGYDIYILADSKKQQERLAEIIESRGEGQEPIVESREDEAFIPISQTLHEGFIDHDVKACFFTDHQIFDRFHKYNLKSDKARQGKMALTLKELQEMEPGDFIVHVDFGIGKFAGLVRVPIQSRGSRVEGRAQGGDEASYQEMIRLVYQRGDIVDVSIHSLYKISKYRSNDGESEPRLSTLGTGAWERMKERTKKRIKDIARDLIRLYAKRQKERGFAFSPDTFMQQELEASFLYEDTPDQQKATNDVKADMESSQPMDRLICGDVGFGKTEVAVRAAFKAACDSKQVAVLVPTTVLALQHYHTFRDRLRHLPVRVDYLSRARSTKQTRQVLDDLEAGRIDIIIGTHKLIGKNVKWKDLGLLIIDEEQKFGVATKEKLRQVKANVDTLTMSATPIPRTLQFSLMGARDMSIIRTAPPNRYPIQTELASFGGEVIADAINFEMSRNGQVFFVSDRIKGLDHIAELIHRYVPDCRVAIGHGQMKPEELENIIMGFINHDYDVLLSTTIVENGIDIPNANTIIINDAHRFGLSDLHQMRGRVGRSNRKAFCYLLAPPLSVINTEARRRLEALTSFSELGSGFALAIQDLDIRGAGNLLGAEQSGFMEDLGYETYMKILKEAMVELANEKPTNQVPNPSPMEGRHTPERSVRKVQSEELFTPLTHREGQGESLQAGSFVADCTLESDLAMYFPDSYVPGSSERMLLYRELDNIEDDNELEAYRQRLLDRFGAVPHEGEELMQVVVLRRLGKLLGCEKIILKIGRMQMQFVSNTESPFYRSATFDRIINFAITHPQRCALKEIKGKRSLTISDIETVGDAVNLLRSLT